MNLHQQELFVKKLYVQRKKLQITPLISKESTKKSIYILLKYSNS